MFLIWNTFVNLQEIFLVITILFSTCIYCWKPKISIRYLLYSAFAKFEKNNEVLIAQQEQVKQIL